MLFRKRRRLIPAATLVAAALLIAVAYAYWSASGSGSGTASTADPGAQSVTVNQTSSSSGLYPGGSVALSGDFDNPAANAVHVGSVSAAVVSTDTPGCAAADYSISGTAAVAGGGDVPSGAGVGGWSGLTLSMANTASNQDACKGAAVNIDYTAG